MMRKVANLAAGMVGEYLQLSGLAERMLVRKFATRQVLRSNAKYFPAACNAFPEYYSNREIFQSYTKRPRGELPCSVMVRQTKSTSRSQKKIIAVKWLGA